MVSLTLALLVCYGVPIGAFVYLVAKKWGLVRAFPLGLVGFAVSQLLLPPAACGAGQMGLV